MSPLRIRQFGRAAAIRLTYLAAISVSVPLLAWNGFTQQLNAMLGDVVMRFEAPHRDGAVGDIVIVAIDDPSVADIGPLPLKRSVLAKALLWLSEAKPRVLVVDLLLSESTEPAEDEALALALSRFPRVVLAAALAGTPTAATGNTVEGFPWVTPIPDFTRDATLGHVHAEPDADGVVRSILLSKEGGGERMWALGLQAARLFAEADPPLQTQRFITVGSHTIPASEEGHFQMFIHYAGPDGAFPHVPFYRVLANDADKAEFTGKIAILGVTAQGAGDRLFTPISHGIGMSGVEIHASVARTILDDAFLVQPGFGGELLGFAIVCAMPLLLAQRFRGMRLVFLLGVGALLLPLATYVSYQFGLLLPLGSLSVLFVGSSAGAGAGEYAVVYSALRGAQAKQKEYSSRVQAIAHEIKTPLTAIQGSSEMISSGTLTDKNRAQLAGLIHRESKRLTELIHTFLDVERMASGSLELRTTPTDVRSLCDEVVKRAELLAARKGIVIETSINADSVDADSDLLGFAVYNLLSNAVKYSPKHTFIHLSAIEDQHALRISVSDKGFGIAENEQQRIFERFYRAHGNGGEPAEGSGIGLALVKEIVTQHGGEVLLESTPGQGSRFTIVLPKTEVAEVQQAVRRRPK